MELGGLLDRQLDLQRRAFELDPTQLEGEARLEFIRWNVLALQAELVEMLEETGWKPWSTSDHVHEGRFLGEWVDALHFMLNLALVGGQPTDPHALGDLLSQAYMDKRQVNIDRQVVGYSGRKCPSCGRELDGKLAPRDAGEGHVQCVACGHVFAEEVNNASNDEAQEDRTSSSA